MENFTRSLNDLIKSIEERDRKFKEAISNMTKPVRDLQAMFGPKPPEWYDVRHHPHRQN